MYHLYISFYNEKSTYSVEKDYVYFIFENFPKTNLITDELKIKLKKYHKYTDDFVGYDIEKDLEEFLDKTKNLNILDFEVGDCYDFKTSFTYFYIEVKQMDFVDGELPPK